MSRRRRRAGWMLAGRVVTAMVLSLTVPALLSAQTVRWELLGLRGSFCIEFLIAPEALSRTPFKATDALPAARAEGLSAVLAGVVARADSFGTWYPSSLCLLQADSSRVGTHVQRHGDRPVSVLLWRLNGSPGLPGVVMATESRLIDAGGLSRTAELMKFESTFDLDRVTAERVTTAAIDETTLVWDGFALPDTLPELLTGEPWQMVGPAPAWHGSLELDGVVMHRVTGSLSIRGTGPLASVLGLSPVQWVNGYGIGGTAVVTFTR